MAIIVFLLTFFVVAGVITVVWVFAGADVGQEQIRKRMNAVHKAERRGDVSQSLKLVRDEMLSDVPVLTVFSFNGPGLPSSRISLHRRECELSRRKSFFGVPCWALEVISSQDSSFASRTLRCP